MNREFSREYYLRTCDFDRRNQITPSAILDLFQDAAGAHAVTLGCGYDSLSEKEMMWVLVRVRYKMYKQPSLFSRVTVKTWPLKPARLVFERDYEILDENGETLCVGSSEWVVVHAVKRRFMSAEGLYNIGEFCSRRAFGEKAPKLRETASEEDGFPFTPTFSDIDMNGHVNNTKYAAFLLNAAPPEQGEEIKYLQIDYRQELFAGENVTLFVKRDGKALYGHGALADGKTCFISKIEYK